MARVNDEILQLIYNESLIMSRCNVITPSFLDNFSYFYVTFALVKISNEKVKSNKKQTIISHEEEFDIFIESFKIFLERQAQS